MKCRETDMRRFPKHLEIEMEQRNDIYPGETKHQFTVQRLASLLPCLHPLVFRRFRRFIVLIPAFIVLSSMLAPQKVHTWISKSNESTTSQIWTAGGREKQGPNRYTLPSIALRRILTNFTPSPVIRSNSSFKTDNSEWPSAIYFQELPSVDDPVWPPFPNQIDKVSTSPQIKREKHQNQTATASSGITIATCLPSMAVNVYDPRNVANFLLSNQRQKLPPDELIFLFSDMDSVLSSSSLTTTAASTTTGAQDPSSATITGDVWCRDIQQFIQSNFHPNSKVICLGERITAGRARNAIARFATSDVLAFIDDDDQEEPDRNLVVRQVFGCNPQLQLLLHSNYGTGRGAFGAVRYHPYDKLRSSSSSTSTSTLEPPCPDRQEGVEVLRGKDLRRMLDDTQDVLKFGIKTVGGIRPGHPVIRRDTFRYVQFPSVPNGEDTIMARDIVYAYGIRDEATMFLNRPLSTYFQSGHSFKEVMYPKKKKEDEEERKGT